MDIVVIDYRLCAFEYSFHAHKPFNHIFTKLSQLLLSHRINPKKLIFAVDTGASKRREIYPEYKLHRTKQQKKATPAEQLRRQEFERFYKESIQWLNKLGTVLDLAGIEADDIGSIVAHRFADTEHQITLVTSDKDWASFLVADNIRILHVSRDTFISAKNCVEEYELDPLGIFWVQCFAGSDKENVKGIFKFGIKTFKKIYDEQTPKDFDKIKTTIEEDYLVKGFRGMQLPEGVNYDDMCSLNYSLFKPVVFEDLSMEEQDLFLQKFHVSTKDTYDNLVLELLMDYGVSLTLTPQERSIYKLK
jgi:5'-3' exonuclease